MPTYEFACPNGHEFDKFYRSMSAAPSELPCPTCGATATRQVSGGAGLVFKGSGFYITDYGKDGKKDLKGAKPAASSSGTDGGTGAAKSEGSSGGAGDSAPKTETKSDAAKPATPPSSGSSE